MTTPFPFETIPTKEFFYGRENELKDLKSHIQNYTNVLLFSKRRMGKSTLIKNLLKEIEDNHIVIYIDICNIITAEDFARLLIKGIIASEKGDILASIKKLTSSFKKISVEPTFDSKTEEMGIKAITYNLSFNELIEDSFAALFKLTKEKKVVLAIDDIQQISNMKDINIAAVLRKYIQESNNISYIFIGSKGNALNSMFTNNAQLYSIASQMPLKALKIKDIYNYAKEYLNVSKELIEYIYELCKGETKLIHMVLHRIYIDKDNSNTIDSELVDAVIDEVLVSKNDFYKTLFQVLSINQKKAFRLLAKYGKELFSEKILKEENISRSSMQSSLKQLFAKEYIDKENGNYLIPDPAFELWAKKYL